jgi:hypothetical protein
MDLAPVTGLSRKRGIITDPGTRFKARRRNRPHANARDFTGFDRNGDLRHSAFRPAAAQRGDGRAPDAAFLPVQPRLPAAQGAVEP